MITTRINTETTISKDVINKYKYVFMLLILFSIK